MPYPLLFLRIIPEGNLNSNLFSGLLRAGIGSWPLNCRHGFFKDNNVHIHDICLSTCYLGKSAEWLQDVDFFFGLFSAALVGQCCKKVPNLLVNLLLSSNRLGDFITQQIPVAVA